LTPADIKANLEIVRERIAAACLRAGRAPQEVTLIAVSKTVDAVTVEAAFRAGIGNFGENRVQEAQPKIQSLLHLAPRPTWHLIGHLQSNKVKTALELFDIIHSVDSIELAENLNRRAGRKRGILLEVNIAGEASKNGFPESALKGAMAAISKMPDIEIRGLMTVAPLVAEAEEVRPVFRRLRALRDSLGLKELSMGMTDDFEIAVEEGSTLVRIGRAIFGERRSII
jgi:PLP dependent protein